MNRVLRKLTKYLRNCRKYILVILSMFFLIVFFVWGERIVFFSAQKINDQKIANFFSIIGSIVTTISIFLIYRQIQEVINDRKAQSLPKLFPEEYAFKTYTIENTQDPKDGKIKSFVNPVVESELSSEEHNDALFSISNVGNGTAINVSITWIYEISEIENAVSDIYILLFTGLEGFDINYIRANESERGHYGPLNYIQILGDKSRIEKHEVLLGNLDLPELSLNIEYSDLHGNKYEHNRFSARITKNGANEFVMRFVPYRGSGAMLNL